MPNEPVISALCVAIDSYRFLADQMGCSNKMLEWAARAAFVSRWKDSFNRLEIKKIDEQVDETIFKFFEFQTIVLKVPAWHFQL